MSDTLDLNLAGLEPSSANGDNITDWALEQFQAKYGPGVTKDDIWEYLYGVMHAPDWRERYRHDLERNLPRIPLAEDFDAFRASGRKLIELHIGYETVEEAPVTCLVDGVPDDGRADDGAYRIESRMRWGRKPDGSEDRRVLHLNSRCRLVDIPLEAQDYTVSGRSPLQWAIDSLRLKHDKASGITDDPNGWRDWTDEPFNLVRHLRRLVTVSVETARIVASLPPSLPEAEAPVDSAVVTLADLRASAGVDPIPAGLSTGVIYGSDEEFLTHLRSQPAPHS
ncbi:MAG: hypothetical protein OXH20_04030 [bacterium]|nr:hypothetical protein [bacterium]MDE0669591.1 hypothetical protein [bacterium]